MKHFIVLFLGVIFFAFLPLAVAEGPIPEEESWGELISKEEAEEYTQLFSIEVESIKAHLFSAQIILGIINQHDARGIRFYHATINDRPTLVAVGVDENGNDLQNEKFAERSRPCPPWCADNTNKVDWSKAGEFISKEEAELYTQRFAQNIGGIRAHLFSSDILLNIITQYDAHGVRLYYGEYNNRITLVAVGVNANGSDLLEGKLAERSRPCPPWCSEYKNIIALAKIVD